MPPALRRARLNAFLTQTRHFLGLNTSTTTSNTEKLISGLGAIIGILLTQWIAQQFFDLSASLFFVGSMAATTVLIFALPHGTLSQPWNLFAGHILSAVVGILCQQTISDPMIAASLAVGLSICLMHYTNSLHPPGGATALFYVMGGEQVHQLGFHFIYAPLLINLICLVSIAFAFNCCFHWRRYPAHLNFKQSQKASAQYALSQEDFNAAIRAQDSFVDVSSDEIIEIVNQAIANAQANTKQNSNGKKLTLQVNHFYSNAGLGDNWSVREITAIERKQIQFKVVAGADKGMLASTSIKRFRGWAKHQVSLANQHWIKSHSTDSKAATEDIL